MHAVYTAQPVRLNNIKKNLSLQNRKDKVSPVTGQLYVKNLSIIMTPRPVQLVGQNGSLSKLKTMRGTSPPHIKCGTIIVWCFYDYGSYLVPYRR